MSDTEHSHTHIRVLDRLLFSAVALLGVCVILFAVNLRSDGKEIRALREQVDGLLMAWDHRNEFELFTLEWMDGEHRDEP